VLTGLSAATGAREVARSVGLRLALAAASGIFVGGYVALEFFPGQGPLQACLLNCSRPLIRPEASSPLRLYSEEMSVSPDAASHARWATDRLLLPRLADRATTWSCGSVACMR